MVLFPLISRGFLWQNKLYDRKLYDMIFLEVLWRPLPLFSRLYINAFLASYA